MLISGGQFAPIAYGDATPSWSNRNYYPSDGLALSRAFASYAAVYKSQVWVATLVNKLAYGTARLPLKVYERAADGGRFENRDHPYAKLLRSPNSRHDPFFFWLWTASTLEIYGEALWIKDRPAPGRPPMALYPLHPSNVYTRRLDSDSELVGTGLRATAGTLVYSYHVGSSTHPTMEWPEQDIVHFRSYNPENQVRGLSRLEPLRQTILNEDAARRAAAAFWQNGGRPSMTVTVEGGLSQQAADRLTASLQNLHSGVDNWGRIAVLEEGATPTLLPLNAEEMQYIESRKINREEACGIYDVPPPVVHILDRATFSNITEQMRSMYRDTMAPRLSLLESVLDTQLRPDFSTTDTVYAEFLMDEVLRGAFEDRAAAMQSAINSGLLTPNEGRRIDNRPPLEGGDRLYINAAVIPLADAAQGNPTGTNIVEHPQAIKSIPQSAVFTVMGRLGRVKNVQDIDVPLLTTGLGDAAESVAACVSKAAQAGMGVEDLRLLVRDLEEPEPAEPTPPVVVNVHVNQADVNIPPTTVTVAPAEVKAGDVTVNLPRRTTKTITRDANGDIAAILEESS